MVLARIRSEWAYLTGAMRALRRVTPIARRPERVWPDEVEELARRFGHRPALVSDHESFTYAEYDARGNRYARWAMGQGLAKGETVALLMPNRPEYLCIWLGIVRAGGVCALVNTNLTGAALAHSLNIVAPVHAIVAAELAPAFESARPFLEGAPTLWLHGEAPFAGEGPPAGDAPRIDHAVEAPSGAPIPPGERPRLTIEDRALYIYTSGTTGLPKAANINHYRVLSIMHGFSAATGATREDRIYDCLPLYHTSGGILAPGIALTVGGAVVIRERFSAREFWSDVVRHDCTMVQYIGELCRYLLNAPEHPDETRHRLRLVNGNGLRPDIWEAFAARFRIPRILEWYAATEGNVVLFNFDGRPGAIGRIPKWLERRFVVRLVRYDVEAGAPVRGADGLCAQCAPGEVGEALGQIRDDPRTPANRYEGYADARASETKILRDVFEPGDAWFRTGDLMRRDARGYFFFVDRIGDTFRWKGENVSTSEVAEALNRLDGVRESTVYGVGVPGHEGRAGMAALVADGALDLAAFKAHADAALAPYARPLFLRLAHDLDVTGTFKQRKLDLVDEGFDPARATDPLYYACPETGRYEPFDKHAHVRLLRGELRL